MKLSVAGLNKAARWAAIITLLLAANGCNTTDKPQASPLTSTPTQPVSPVAVAPFSITPIARSPEPTDGTSDAPSKPQTTESSSGKFKQVEIGILETYTYDNGLFEIDVPREWTRQDNSKSGEAIVQWADSAVNGMIVVDLFAAEGNQTQEQLTNLLQNFLNSIFKSQPDFSMDQPVVVNDGSVRITWSYTATAGNGVKGTLMGNSFIEQRGDKISVLTYALPQEQFPQLEKPINQILSSYKINHLAPLP